MRPISVKTTIDAPRERVFARLLDISGRAAFTDHFLHQLRLQRIEPVGVGASARFRIGKSGPWMDLAITEADHPHRILERGHGGRENRIPTNIAWELVDAPGGGCELSFMFWTEPSHPLDRLHEPWSARTLRRGWRRALRRLKDDAEANAAPVPVGVGGGSRIPY